MTKDQLFMSENSKGSPVATPNIFVEYDIETKCYQFHVEESAKPHLKKEAKTRGFTNMIAMMLHDCKIHADHISTDKNMTFAIADDPAFNKRRDEIKRTNSLIEALKQSPGHLSNNDK